MRWTVNQWRTLPDEARDKLEIFLRENNLPVLAWVNGVPQFEKAQDMGEIEKLAMQAATNSLGSLPPKKKGKKTRSKKTTKKPPKKAGKSKKED
jgi:hypothetical protein